MEKREMLKQLLNTHTLIFSCEIGSIFKKMTDLLTHFLTVSTSYIRFYMLENDRLTHSLFNSLQITSHQWYNTIQYTTIQCNTIQFNITKWDTIIDFKKFVQFGILYQNVSKRRKLSCHVVPNLSFCHNLEYAYNQCGVECVPAVGSSLF